jgi:phage gp36-like protein
MPYATQVDLVSRFGETEIIQLSDRTGTAGAIDSAVVADKLADADAEIDGYLQGRYTLPLSPVPTVLVRVAADIARYHLYDDRATEQVTKRYTDAINFLELVAKGDVQLGVTPDGTPAETGAGPESVNPGRVFTTDSLKDFVG